MNPYDFHGGDYGEIEKHCQRIVTPMEKVNYLEWCLAEVEKVIWDNRHDKTRLAYTLYDKFLR